MKQSLDSEMASSVLGSQKTLKILIADDNQSDRMILQNIVKKQGHDTATAVDGVDAIEKFSEFRPDIVLLDALMPRMDGFEAARKIKLLAGEDLIPIIFLTSLSDAESLAKCLEAGGDDFLSKPYNRIILQAKINAFNRMRIMHKTLLRQRDQIAEHNDHMVREQQVAKTVFDNVAHVGCLGANNIKHLLSPLAVFNGDVLLACQKPSGGMHVLLGDFTGHGLPAAIGAMPLAEIFYGMTSKGYALGDILREVNQKLRKILPVGFFCCACMAELNFEQEEIEIWIGGLPDCYLVQGDQLLKVASNRLPLGILKGEAFDARTYRFEMKHGDRVYLWSDGIVEATNAKGEMFGEKRLQQVFEDNLQEPNLFEKIRRSVVDFMGEGGPSDDLTLVELTMMPEKELGIENNYLTNTGLKGPQHWRMAYELCSDSLAVFDPVPLLLQIVMEVPGLRTRNGEMFTILSELYTNALEHGVLGLHSKLKASPDGFAEYYRLREERIRQLDGHFVKVDVRHKGALAGGVLTIRVEDSGKGFDYQKLDGKLPGPTCYSGRGTALLLSMCSRVEYFGQGNIVEVDYEWQA
ncbi:SpoIIE family protein phosphatase [Hahella sp. CR1]|uniref:ATP-binding SpoIIE family protein phosphatase n=1 Tax=Hahella sp. CR1 TaxID=2992807 RepID=UPI0024427ABE|nr:SpoIIE family protein phosphatase [Hahella sp. CR1]MDG9668330.1 SpoIIE family protein phosphatase [Hahella sp. CR1]